MKKNKIHYLFFLLICLCINVKINAQTLKGKIYIGEGEKALPNCEVLLYNKVKKYHSFTNEQGEYMFENLVKDNYVIDVYKNRIKVFSRNIQITKDIEYFDISTTIKTKQIEEVVLTKNKKIFENKIDKLVFNVSESIYDNGFSASEVVSKMPMIMVNESGITVANRGNLLFYIDDKRIYLDGNDLVNYLKNIPSSTISKVELITNPPAKYDAEGSIGIINIVTKRDLKNLLNSTYSTSFIRKSNNGYNNNFTLNYNKNKFQINTRLNYSDLSQTNTAFTKVYNNDLENSIDEIQPINTKSIGGSATINYNLSKNINMALLYDFKSTTIENQIEASYINKTSSLISQGINYNESKRDLLSHTLNFSTDIKLDTLGKKITFLSSVFSNKNLFNQINNNFLNQNNNSKYNIYSLQTDIYIPLKKEFDFSFGGKMLWVNNDLLFLYLNSENEINYQERINSLYVSISKKINDKFSIKGGLRYEHFINDFNSNDLSKKYNGLFPTFYIFYKPNENNSLSLSYSKRVTRPSFRLLDPFKIMIADNHYIKGNPDLSPYFTHNIETNYMYKNNLNIMLYATKNVGMYTKYTNWYNNTQEDTYANFFDLLTTGINIRYTFNKIKNIESSIMTNLSYSKTYIQNSSFLAKNGIIFYYYLDNNFYLDKKKNILFTLSYLHSLPTNSVNSYMSAYANLTAGMKFNLLEKQLQINISVSDLFKQLEDKRTYFYSTYNQYVSSFNDTRTLNFGVTYKFGKLKASNKSINFEEKQRAD